MENGPTDPEHGARSAVPIEVSNVQKSESGTAAPDAVMADTSAPGGAIHATAANGAAEHGAASKATLGAAKLPKIIPFTDLCRCGDEVWIEHDGQLYRLRRTRLGKLILTK
jgi:hemin uptake protein HemP